MTARQQTRPRRSYQHYETDSLTGRLQMVAQPSFESIARPRVLSGVLLLALIGLAIWIGLDDRFYITRLNITGNARVPADEIAQASGIAGLHIFWLNAGEVEARLPAALSSIRGARVACKFPAACTIDVQERQPVVAWQFGSAVTWIDADSVTFAARGGDDKDAPITIESTQGPALFPGRPADPKIVQAAVSLGQALPEVRHYRYSGAHGLEFDDPRGFPVYLGLGQDMAERIAIWRALSAQLAARNVQPKFVDVRYPAAPYYGE